MVSLLAESITWGTVVTLAFLSRFCTRVVKFGQVERYDRSKGYNVIRGLTRLQLEDYLMLTAFAFYCSELVTMNITAKLQSNLFPPGYLDTHVLSAQEVKDRRYGSKMTVVVEQCQIMTIWLVKLCVLTMWFRLTDMAYKWRKRIVMGIGLYVIVCLIVMEGFYFGYWCRPFSNYYAVPTPNPKQCAAAWNHLIMNAVFNLTSDLVLLAVSFSIAFERNFKGLRRVAFFTLCSLGVFVIVCAILNKSYSWRNPFGSAWTFWYIRESSTAMFLSNVPYAWQIFKRIFGIKDRVSSQRRESSNTSQGSKPSLNRICCRTQWFKRGRIEEVHEVSSLDSSSDQSPSNKSGTTSISVPKSESLDCSLGNHCRNSINGKFMAEALAGDDCWAVRHSTPQTVARNIPSYSTMKQGSTESPSSTSVRVQEIQPLNAPCTQSAMLLPIPEVAHSRLQPWDQASDCETGTVTR